MLEGVPVTLRRARRLPAAHPAAPIRHRGARHGSPFCRGGENSLKASGSVALKYSFRGRQRFYTIGRHGIITVEEARTDARRLLGLAASGIDPAIAREEQSLQPPALTVGELCASYLKEGPAYKPDKRDSSWYSDRSNINRHIVPLIG